MEIKEINPNQLLCFGIQYDILQEYLIFIFKTFDDVLNQKTTFTMPENAGYTEPMCCFSYHGIDHVQWNSGPTDMTSCMEDFLLQYF